MARKRKTEPTEVQTETTENLGETEEVTGIEEFFTPEMMSDNREFIVRRKAPDWAAGICGRVVTPESESHLIEEIKRLYGGGTYSIQMRSPTPNTNGAMHFGRARALKIPGPPKMDGREINRDGSFKTPPENEQKGPLPIQNGPYPMHGGYYAPAPTAEPSSKGSVNDLAQQYLVRALENRVNDPGTNTNDLIGMIGALKETVFPQQRQEDPFKTLKQTVEMIGLLKGLGSDFSFAAPEREPEPKSSLEGMLEKFGPLLIAKFMGGGPQMPAQPQPQPQPQPAPKPAGPPPPPPGKRWALVDDAKPSEGANTVSPQSESAQFSAGSARPDGDSGDGEEEYDDEPLTPDLVIEELGHLPQEEREAWLMDLFEKTTGVNLGQMMAGGGMPHIPTVANGVKASFHEAAPADEVQTDNSPRE